MRLESTQVALTPCAGYEETPLDDCIDRVLAALTPRPTLNSARVVLKPNLITASRGILPCTQPAFILAAARWFVDHGAQVRIGDSPAFGTATSVLRALGIHDELCSLGVRITDFKKVRTVQLRSGTRARVAVDAMDCDLLVNLPRVKAHAQTRVTLAVKNCFGCLVGLHKPRWHMMYGGKDGRFADLLVELLDVLADSLTLVDGITAMDGTGPVHGRPFPLGITGASMNPVAMDRALLETIDLAPEKSPLMEACRAANIAGAHRADLSFPLAAPQELQAPDFTLPAKLNPVRFSVLRFFRSSLKRAAALAHRKQ
jgi:uncharacterized protein (DUF362 family)